MQLRPVLAASLVAGENEALDVQHAWCTFYSTVLINDLDDTFTTLDYFAQTLLVPLSFISEFELPER